MHRLQLKWKVTDVIIFCNNYVNKKGKDPMSAIPKDPMILLSYINTQLRDNYSSLEELCQAMDLDEDQIKKTLSDIGFEYEPEWLFTDTMPETGKTESIKALKKLEVKQNW